MKFCCCIVLLAIGGLSAQDENMSRAELERLATAQRRMLLDWAGLTRYGSENADLKAPGGEKRVVFLGDEITERWTPFFPGKPYLNRGITGQTTAQMLVRFRQDVISLQPKVVVIMAGSNDVASDVSPMTQGVSEENFQSMAELAEVHGIRVVLASLTPVCDCFRNLTSRRPAGKLLGMNSWLTEYAERAGAEYADLHGALAQGRSM